MKKLLTIAFSVFALSAVSQQWYEGGTLHNKTMKEWSAASYQNRLATASDMAVAILEQKGMNVNVLTMEQMKSAAKKMKSCLDEANSDGSMNREAVSFMAAACHTVMNVSVR